VSWLKWLPALVVVISLGAYRYFSTVPVRVVVSHRGDVIQEVFGRGTLESRRTADLGFDLVGRISDLRVDEGDSVKLGQVLGSLALEQLNADVKTASSGVLLAKASIARLDAEAQRAAATLVFAVEEEERSRKLAAAGSISARDMDLAVQQLSLAQAEAERVRSTRDEAHRQIAVASDTAQGRSVTASRAVLVAPFDGVVVRRMRDPGDTVTVGTTVLRLVATDVLWSRAWVDEMALPLLNEKAVARVRLGAEGLSSLTGQVDRVGREVDRQTHELLVDVLLSHPPPRVAIGQRADVWIEVGRQHDVMTIPLSFIHRGPGGPFCFVDEGGRIARRQLTLGMEGTDLIEVKTGLNEGEQLLDSPEPGGALAEGRRWAKKAP
jgi:HlyD family secretion protein